MHFCSNAAQTRTLQLLWIGSQSREKAPLTGVARLETNMSEHTCTSLNGMATANRNLGGHTPCYEPFLGPTSSLGGGVMQGAGRA